MVDFLHTRPDFVMAIYSDDILSYKIKNTPMPIQYDPLKLHSVCDVHLNFLDVNLVCCIMG